MCSGMSAPTAGASRRHGSVTGAQSCAWLCTDWLPCWPTFAQTLHHSDHMHCASILTASGIIGICAHLNAANFGLHVSTRSHIYLQVRTDAQG